MVFIGSSTRYDPPSSEGDASPSTVNTIILISVDRMAVRKGARRVRDRYEPATASTRPGQAHRLRPKGKYPRLTCAAGMPFGTHRNPSKVAASSPCISGLWWDNVAKGITRCPAKQKRKSDQSRWFPTEDMCALTLRNDVLAHGNVLYCLPSGAEGVALQP